MNKSEKTILYTDSVLCTGCGACSQSCPQNAIAMQYDEEGFLYPVINTTLCNQCGLCIHVCHMQNGVAAKKMPLQIYAASLPNTEELAHVSSGGVFWAFAEHVINKSGVVYGVEHPSLFEVHHSRAETIEQCLPFRRSKYLESATNNAYVNVKKDLKANRSVLFTGTGCQVAGLYSFLGDKKHDNLITCEVVCHGVPSMKVFENYIQELEKIHNKKVDSIIYRDKSIGWSKNCIRIRFSDGSSVATPSSETPIHRGYLSGYYYRPACAQCRYARIPRIADITLADYWKYNGTLTNNNFDKGISLVVCSSSAGVKLLDAVKHRLDLDSTDLESAIKSCRHLNSPPSESKYRGAFFKNFTKHGFHSTYYKFRRKEATTNFFLCKLTPITLRLRYTFRKESTHMTHNNMIKNYYGHIHNKLAHSGPFAQKVIEAVVCKNQDRHIYIESNRYFKKILNILGTNCITDKKATETAEHFYLLYQVLGTLVDKGVPCYIFGRPNSISTEHYSELAQERIKNRLDFPVMSEDYDKYEKHFSEILKDQNSKDFVEELKKVPQVIKRDYLYGHEDFQSQDINIIDGRRVVTDFVDAPDKTIHVYGRCGVFGYAVRDSENIPSLLQKKLKVSSENKFGIVNHGLWGAGDDLILNNLVVNANSYGEKDIIVLYMMPPLKEELEHLQKKGIYYYDCTQPFHNDKKSDYCFYDRAGHMSAEGYAILSSFIHEKLTETEFKCGKVRSDSLQLSHDYVSEYLSGKTSDDFQKNLTRYLENIKSDYPLRSDEKKIGSIVMNCNPFTLGHYYLIEYASKKVDRLYIFILQEDKSFFKFKDRIELVRKGTEALKNVIVIPSGEFMISALTFPEYFMKDYKKSIDFDATKDLHTYGTYIAPALGISIRFAGEEPIDVVTREYNRSMERLLPTMGVEFHEIPRKTVDGKQVVSASKVRALMKEDKWEEIKAYVPETTYTFLIKNFRDKS